MENNTRAASHPMSDGLRAMTWIRLLPVLLICTLMAGRAAAFGRLKPGDNPPDTLVKSASGERIRLADYRGKIVIISFWASWCPPCRKELPVLAGMQEEATREKLVVFSVNWRQSSDEFQTITRALKKIDLTLVSDASGSIGSSYNVTAIPHMVVIGRDGKIAAIHVGYSESEFPALADEVNALWAKSSTDTP